ncbi:MAG: OmpA family protein [Azospirillaceae bacterium]
MTGRRLLAASALALAAALPAVPAAAQTVGEPSVLIGTLRVACDQLGFSLRQRLAECVVERPRGLILDRPAASPATITAATPAATLAAPPQGGESRLPDDVESSPTPSAQPFRAPLPAPSLPAPDPEQPAAAAEAPARGPAGVAAAPADVPADAGIVRAGSQAGPNEPDAPAGSDGAGVAVVDGSRLPPAPQEDVDLPPPEVAAADGGEIPPLRPADRPLSQPPQSVLVAGGLDTIALAAETGRGSSIFDDPGSPETPGQDAASVASVPVPASLPGEGEAIGTMADLRGYVIRFEPGQSELSAAAESLLLGLSERLQADADAMVQIRAFATSSPSDGSGGSRVMSLYRALAVRNALMNMGVRATAIDIRALGDAVESEPFERVDIEFGSR